MFRARLDHAADLYRKQVAPVIVVTGGKQPGDRFTEASAGADYLHTKGVPDDRDPARDDRTVLVGVARRRPARFLAARDIRRVVLVSDPFHSLRIQVIAAEAGFSTAVTSPTRTSPITGIDEWERFFGEALRVAGRTIFGFGRLARPPRPERLRARGAAATGSLHSLRSRATGLAILGGPSGVV